MFIYVVNSNILILYYLLYLLIIKLFYYIHVFNS